MDSDHVCERRDVKAMEMQVRRLGKMVRWRDVQLIAGLRAQDGTGVNAVIDCPLERHWADGSFPRRSFEHRGENAVFTFYLEHRAERNGLLCGA